MSKDVAATSEQVPSLTVRDLLDAKRQTLNLELLNPSVPLDGEVADSDVSSPGLALAGYTQRFVEGRMQVFGETEITYLDSLDSDECRARLAGVFQFPIPAAFITKGQPVPDEFLEVATEFSIPVLRTAVSTKEFYWRIKPYLDAALAPRTHLHGSLADVYGVGLLVMGKSGVGKSECVLDLVERGHRLVADDLVIVSKRGSELLLGEGHELQGHHMEIRGLGIIDIKTLFGIRATRRQKRIEVIVQLEHWDGEKAYTRTGLETEETEVLGVPVPKVTIPINPGKNITVISEVVAMNHLLKYSGVDSATAFNEKLQDAMRPIREYLEQDYE